MNNPENQTPDADSGRSADVARYAALDGLIEMLGKAARDVTRQQMESKDERERVHLGGMFAAYVDAAFMAGQCRHNAPVSAAVIGATQTPKTHE